MNPIVQIATSTASTPSSSTVSLRADSTLATGTADKQTGASNTGRMIPRQEFIDTSDELKTGETIKSVLEAFITEEQLEDMIYPDSGNDADCRSCRPFVVYICDTEREDHLAEIHEPQGDPTSWRLCEFAFGDRNRDGGSPKILLGAHGIEHAETKLRFRYGQEDDSYYGIKIHLKDRIDTPKPRIREDYFESAYNLGYRIARLSDKSRKQLLSACGLTEKEAPYARIGTYYSILGPVGRSGE